MNFESTASIWPFLLNEVNTSKLTNDLSLWSSLEYSSFNDKALSNVFRNIYRRALFEEISLESSNYFWLSY